MYGFTPTDEQKMLIDTAVRYAKTDLRAAGHDADVEKSLPERLVGKGWEVGVHVCRKRGHHPIRLLRSRVGRVFLRQ